MVGHASAPGARHSSAPAFISTQHPHHSPDSSRHRGLPARIARCSVVGSGPTLCGGSSSSGSAASSHSSRSERGLAPAAFVGLDGHWPHLRSPLLLRPCASRCVLSVPSARAFSSSTPYARQRSQNGSSLSIGRLPKRPTSGPVGAQFRDAPGRSAAGFALRRRVPYPPAAARRSIRKFRPSLGRVSLSLATRSPDPSPSHNRRTTTPAWAATALRPGSRHLPRRSLLRGLTSRYRYDLRLLPRHTRRVSRGRSG